MTDHKHSLRGDDVRQVVGKPPTDADRDMLNSAFALVQEVLHGFVAVVEIGTDPSHDPPSIIIWGNTNVPQGSSLAMCEMEGDQAKYKMIDMIRKELAITKPEVIIVAMPVYMRACEKGQDPNDVPRQEKILVYAETDSGCAARSAMRVTRDGKYELSDMEPIEWAMEATYSALVDFYDRHRVESS